MSSMAIEKHDSAVVLVVDDHRPAAEMLAKLFETNNYTVMQAHNGKEALQVLHKHQPDLVLLDIMMPGMSGLEVLQQMRRDERTAAIPAILITAKDSPDEVAEGLKLGADDYLPKPFAPVELLARAKSKIEARRLRDALRRRTTDLEALLRVGEELSNQIEIDDLQRLILYLVIDLLPCSIASIHRYDDNRELLANVVSRDDGTLLEQEIDAGPIWQMIDQTSRVVVWENGEIYTGTELFAGMAVVLVHGDSIHGLLTILGTTPFDENHIRLFEGVSRQATLAIRNAELYAVKTHYAQHLEEMVEARTAELKSAQQLLIQAEKLASIGRLAAGIAHEINNPLMPILLNLEYMFEDINDGRAINANDVEATLNSARRIKSIVDRLLQFTRKRDIAEPGMELLHIKSIVENMIAFTRKFFEQDQISVLSHLDDGAYVYGGRDQLEQVFLNIMLNAKAAMPPGGILTISSEIQSNHVILQFTDTGCGIAPDIIDQIFEPFVSTKENGTGLGLFISYEIIQNHQGSIEVESTIGDGTTFTIKLPIAENAEMVDGD